MNKPGWIGVIVWGAFFAGFGLSYMGVGGSDIAPQNVVFLIVGGMVTCLTGVIGLAGAMGWAPGLPTEAESCS